MKRSDVIGQKAGLPTTLYSTLGVYCTILQTLASLRSSITPDVKMDTALDEARKALRRGEVPVGCALYTSSGELVATGSNRTNERGNATAHAEFIALEQLSRPECPHLHPTAKDLTLYVTCEPCIMCAAALVQSGVIARIEFGCANPRFGGCGSVRSIDINGSDDGVRLPTVVGGIRATECVQLLSEFYTTTNPNAPKPKKRRAVT